MVGLILKRILIGALLLVVVSIAVFFAVELLPGDLAQELLGQAATPEAVETLRRNLGLDQPAVVRYLDWLSGFVRGDLGQSLSNGQDIATVVAQRLSNTLFLAAITASIAVPLAISIGLATAIWRDSWFDRLANGFVLTAISTPEFFVAYLLVGALSINLGWFPSISNINDGLTFWEKVYRTLLPAATLTLVVTAHMMRLTRASIISLLSSAYIEMAHLKGARRSTIILRHALPNALIPIINVVVLNLAYLITGVVVVETVFVYPGLGQLLVDSVSKRDLPVVQAACMIFGATYIVLNLIADVLSVLSSPRQRGNVN